MFHFSCGLHVQNTTTLTASKTTVFVRKRVVNLRHLGWWLYLTTNRCLVSPDAKARVNTTKTRSFLQAKRRFPGHERTQPTQYTTHGPSNTLATLLAVHTESLSTTHERGLLLRDAPSTPTDLPKQRRAIFGAFCIYI